MMANRQRGEVAAILNGREMRLCLTLGALAELEEALGADDLGELVAKFSTGHMKADALTAVIAAGLRGAGNDVSLEEVRKMQCEGGVGGMVKLAADLLAATFGNEADAA